MHLDGGVTLLKIEKVSRPGFNGLFHCVTFELQADGLTPSWCQVWVHSAYADTDLERVAHSLLSRKLLDLAKAASARSCSTVLLDAPGDTVLATVPERNQKTSEARFLPIATSEADPKMNTRPNGARIARYILSGHDPVPCDDLGAWIAWMRTPGRWVESTEIIDSAGSPVRVCTVFIGLDLSFGLDDPILFETMVLGGTYDRELYRYCTWDESRTGHAAVVDRVQACHPLRMDPPDVSNARNRARRTMKIATQITVQRLLERTQPTSDRAK